MKEMCGEYLRGVKVGFVEVSHCSMMDYYLAFFSFVARLSYFSFYVATYFFVESLIFTMGIGKSDRRLRPFILPNEERKS